MYIYIQTHSTHADSLHPHSHSILRIIPITYSPHFPHSILQFHILAFTDCLLSFYSLRIYFRKIIALIQKQTLSFFTTAYFSAPNFYLHHQRSHQCYHQKLFTL